MIPNQQQQTVLSPLPTGHTHLYDMGDEPFHQHRSIRTTPDPNEPSWDLEETLFAEHDDIDDDDDAVARTNRRVSFRRENSETLTSPNRTRRGSSETILQPSPEVPVSSVRAKSFQEGRKDSSQSQGSDTRRQSQGSDTRRRRDKNRAAERRLKLEAQVSDVDIGHIADEKHPSLIFPESRSTADRVSGSLSFPSAPSAGKRTDSSRSSNDTTSRNGSTGSVAVSAILNSEINKSSSLIFPIGVSSIANHEGNQEAWKSNAIQQRVNQCEKRKFRKKELLLDDLKLTADDIPLQLLNETTLGNTLQKLTLRGNRLKAIPGKLVQCLPSLRELDLQQCDLRTLPDVLWKLPKLVTLDLSHNVLTFFPEEKVLRGIPELRTLNLHFNRISEVTLPVDTTLLSKLETLDLGANELEKIPDELDQLQSLRLLKLMNNRIQIISRRICDMPSLREIDGLVSNDMVIPPKLECEKGLCMMRRYYHQLVTEEENKKKVKENLRQAQKPKKGYRFLTKMTSSGLKTGASRASSGSFNERQVQTTAFPVTSPSESHASADSGQHVKTPQVELSAPPGNASIENDVTLPSISHDSERGVTVNDTLKVIFVGMEMVGKTSMIRKLIEGPTGEVPTSQERTIGVRIYDWDPQKVRHFEHVRPQIDLQDDELSKECGDIGVKFSVWDFAGQQVYHATHELFFSSQSLFIIVWDMGRNNANTFAKPRRPSTMSETGAFQLYDSSDDESVTREGLDQDGDKLADRALELDIDNKVQFWIDCIQSTCPGSVILPVASFADEFSEFERLRRCQILKRRILQHEARRLVGIKERLSMFTTQKRANDAEALRLQTLLCPLMRPTVLFDEDSPSPIVQTSSPQYAGFAALTESLLDIATGRKKYNGRRLFQGHIGARIPKIRLQVRDTVRSMRSKFKVVEWGFFVSILQKQGITSVEDISDALHFLTNTGELSYFGKILPTPSRRSHESKEDKIFDVFANSSRLDDAEFDDAKRSSVDDTTATTRMTSDGSLSTIDESPPTLSQFVFLNPLWLVAAVACILRHDLDREIKEARRLLAQGRTRELPRTASFHHAQLNCPIITGEDANLLWQGMPITRKYAERAQEHSVNLAMTPFEFLQILLTEFGVFVPVDLNIDRALFGGMNYQQLLAERETRNNGFEVSLPSQVDEVSGDAGQHFFLPSLLGLTEHGDPWTFKTNEAWKTTLSHSITFPDGVPSGLMERLTASVLNVIHIVTNPKAPTARFDGKVNRSAAIEGRIVVKEVLCWRKTFLLKLGLQQSQPDGGVKESIIDIFGHLASQCSHLCVGSDYLAPGMHRLIVSGRGPAGDGGRRIWKGGYLLVLRCLQRVMSGYEGVEYEENCICPSCLANLHLKKACSWDMSILRSAAEHYEEGIHCANGHFVESRLVCGPTFPTRDNPETFTNPDGIKPVEDLFEAVVIVGLWDGKRREIVRAGSGFIVDRKRGLIVTAAHTLMEIWNERDYPFGEDCYGLDRGRVVIGLIPRGQSSSGEAVFRYFAQIIVKDPNLQQNSCKVDACVLRIVSRLEQDVGGNGEECGAQAEIFLLNVSRLTRSEQLSSLRLTTEWEREESVRVLGYNQGGEGLRVPGATLNRSIDFARGYVVRLFKNTVDKSATNSSDRNFEPNEELVVNCLTISGHSGGPCVNLQGKVIGILSRADPTENQRCYLVPSSELEVMVQRAKTQQ